MATAASLSISVSEVGGTTSVPDNDVARLMYYLGCVTKPLGIDILQDDLVDYKNYHRLSRVRIAAVVNSAVELSPDIFIDKLIFKDDAGDVIPSSKFNQFVDITTACDVVSIQQDIIIGGQAKGVTQVMFYHSSWLKKCYTDPLRRLLAMKHCKHCEGHPGRCACSKCPRPSDSKCKPLFKFLLHALLTGITPSSSSAAARSRSRARLAKAPSSAQHLVKCDECGRRRFTGPRFRCNQCHDYDLCKRCYKDDKHIDTGHHFRRYERPNDSPVHLPVRTVSSPSQPPPSPYQSATPTIATTTAPESTPARSSSIASAAASDFFYLTMSISELKAYLSTHDVDAGDILDKETLCKRVWDTYCDCMSVSELNDFLSSKKISIVGCRSINDRREKAKAAFQPPTRPPVARAEGSGGWRKDDIVVLTGLNKVDLNGKIGTIQVVDTAAQKVTIRVDDLGKEFKLKYENIKPYVDLSDAPEELQ